MFLVEHYCPGLTTDRLAAAVADVRAAAIALAAQGRPLVYVWSTIVPSDESYFSLFEAASREDVRAAYARAGVRFERMTEAITTEPGSKEEACAGPH